MKARLTGVLLVLALGLAGCGGSDDDGGGVATAGGATGDPSAAASAGPQLSEEEQRLAFAECMRENGVEVPDPGPDGPNLRFGEGTDPSKVQAAMAACRDTLPNGGEAPRLDAEQVERMRQLARCMRENGVPDFPDPDADGRIRFDRGGAVDPGDTTVRAAMEKCRQYAPRMGGDR